MTSVRYFHLRWPKTVRRILNGKTTTSLVTLSSSVGSTIVISYWSGCRSWASCHCSGYKMPPCSVSLLVRGIAWHRRCVTENGCPSSSASFSNFNALCHYGTLCSIFTSTCLADIRHCFSFLTPFCKQPTVWNASYPSEDQWTLFLIHRSSSMEVSSCIKTFVIIKLLNESLKLNFLTVRTWHNTVCYALLVTYSVNGALEELELDKYLTMSQIKPIHGLMFRISMMCYLSWIIDLFRLG